jgi:cytochrome c oxidase subunit 4
MPAGYTKNVMDEIASANPMHHHVAAVGTYVKVFVLLMVFLVLTMVAALFDLDKYANGLNLAVAMFIAIIKGSMVLLIFMHVKDGSKLLWVFATAAFAWLSIMFILTLTDYSTRGWVPGTAISPPIESNVRAASLEHMSTADDRPVSPPKE